MANPVEWWTNEDDVERLANWLVDTGVIPAYDWHRVKHSPELFDTDWWAMQGERTPAAVVKGVMVDG